MSNFIPHPCLYKKKIERESARGKKKDLGCPIYLLSRHYRYPTLYTFALANNFTLDHFREFSAWHDARYYPTALRIPIFRDTRRYSFSRVVDVSVPYTATLINAVSSEIWSIRTSLSPNEDWYDSIETQLRANLRFTSIENVAQSNFFLRATQADRLQDPTDI